MQKKQGGKLTVSTVAHSLGFMVRAPGNFSPAVARSLVDDYVPIGGVVFDPCAGFGGRMLGTLVSGKKPAYIGQDVAPRTVQALNRLRQTLIRIIPGVEVRSQITQMQSENTTPWPEADLIFTSPPYYDGELYEGDLQSHRVYATYADWREGFLNRFFEKARQALKLGGFFGLVIRDVYDGERAYPIESDARVCGIRNNLVLIRDQPYAVPVHMIRAERLLVFRKVAL